VLPLVTVALVPCVSVPSPCFSAAHTSPLSTTVGPLLASRRLPVRLGPSPTSSLRGAASDPPPFAHCSTLVPPLKSTDRRWADSPPPHSLRRFSLPFDRAAIPSSPHRLLSTARGTPVPPDLELMSPPAALIGERPPPPRRVFRCLSVRHTLLVAPPCYRTPPPPSLIIRASPL
jgi:hypothetical protein